MLALVNLVLVLGFGGYIAAYLLYWRGFDRGYAQAREDLLRKGFRLVQEQCDDPNASPEKRSGAYQQLRRMY